MTSRQTPDNPSPHQTSFPQASVQLPVSGSDFLSFVECLERVFREHAAKYGWQDVEETVHVTVEQERATHPSVAEAMSWVARRGRLTELVLTLREGPTPGEARRGVQAKCYVDRNACITTADAEVLGTIRQAFMSGRTRWGSFSWRKLRSFLRQTWKVLLSVAVAVVAGVIVLQFQR